MYLTSNKYTSKILTYESDIKKHFLYKHNYKFVESNSKHNLKTYFNFITFDLSSFIL